MTKNEFIEKLRAREVLFGLPEEDIARSISFYGELIDDRMEEGMSEECMDKIRTLLIER